MIAIETRIWAISQLWPQTFARVGQWLRSSMRATYQKLRLAPVPVYTLSVALFLESGTTLSKAHSHLKCPEYC